MATFSQIILGYATLFIQAIYPVWSSPFWPASGAALAAVLLGGPRMLWGIYAGLLVLGLKFFWGPYPLWMAFVVPSGNLLETSLAYFLFRQFVPKFDPAFGNIRQLSIFILLCPWIPALISATTSQLLMQYVGSIPPDRFLSELAVYSLGNATGILLVTPLALVWRDFRSFPWKSPQGRKIVAHLGIIFLGLWFYYAEWAPLWGRLVAVAMIPLAVWGVWVTGIRGATLACLLGSISYFAFDVPGSRPFSSLLAEKQKEAELRFVMDKKLTGSDALQPHPVSPGKFQIKLACLRLFVSPFSLWAWRRMTCATGPCGTVWPWPPSPHLSGIGTGTPDWKSKIRRWLASFGLTPVFLFRKKKPAASKSRQSASTNPPSCPIG